MNETEIAELKKEISHTQVMFWVVAGLEMNRLPLCMRNA